MKCWKRANGKEPIDFSKTRYIEYRNFSRCGNFNYEIISSEIRLFQNFCIAELEIGSNFHWLFSIGFFGLWKKPIKSHYLELKNLIEQKYLNIEIQGEISGITFASSGHAYFQLKDEKSQISCVLFRSFKVFHLK